MRLTSRMTSLNVRIERVTNVDDLPELVQTWVIALGPDPFYTFFELYGRMSVYDETFKRMKDGLTDPNVYMFKAVLEVPDETSGGNKDVIIGGTYWYLGYVQIPKYDPFGQRQLETPKLEESVEPADLALGDRLQGQIDLQEQKADTNLPIQPTAEFKEVERQLVNAYIRHIRGKKHIYLRRMFVHPDYQRKGIGEKLLNWGVEEADKQKIVGWLNASPAGSRMYTKAGWKAVTAVPIDFPDLKADPIVAMFREPKAIET